MGAGTVVIALKKEQTMNNNLWIPQKLRLAIISYYRKLLVSTSAIYYYPRFDVSKENVKVFLLTNNITMFAL